jgi:uncharacterized protein YbjT (DUF2867 family)
VAQKKIAVVGATGAQGGGLARAILSDPGGGFAVRALTRKVRSSRAQALAACGAEVVFGDLDQVDTLKSAFAGAYGAFCVTSFWEHCSPERELAQAAAMAAAAESAGLEHVVWSTLEDTRQWVSLDDERMPTLMGKYKVPHFDAKGEGNAEYIRRGVPTTFLLTSFYWDNYINFPGMAPRQQPGRLALVMPMGDSKLPGIAAEDIGRCAYGIFKRGREMVGKRVGVAGEHLTGAELAAGLSRAINQHVSYVDVAPDVFRSLGFPGAADLANMFQFKRDFEDVFCGARSVDRSRELNPSLHTFDRWLSENATHIRV